MLVVQIKPNSVLLAKLTKSFLSRKKELILTSAIETFKGQKVVVILPADVVHIFQAMVISKEHLRDIFNQHLAELGIEENQAVYFAIKLAVTDNSERYLLILINRAKLIELLDVIKQASFQIEGFLPEPVVLYKLLANEIAGDEKRLILNIGKEESRIYLIDRHGPLKVFSDIISTAKLIPATERFLQKIPQIEQACSLGVYFGEESLMFDENVFKTQTGIELISGAKIFSSRLQKTDIALKNGSELNRFVSVGAAAMLFDKKEIIKLDEIEIAAKRAKPLINRPQVKPFVVKEQRFSHFRYLLISAGVALMIAGLTLGVLRLQRKWLLSGQGGIPTIVPTQIQPSLIPSITPVPTVSPQDVKVRVLNGSGVKGAAAKIAASLEEQKFKVVETGNAPSFAFTKTEVHYKIDSKAKMDLIRKSLKEEVSFGTAQASLSEDDEADVEIVIGKE